MLDEERCKQSGLGHLLQLTVTDHLTVFDTVPTGAQGVGLTQGSIRAKNRLDRPVAVAVHGNLHAGIVKCSDPTCELFGRIDQHAVLAGCTRVPFRDTASEALDRSVGPQLRTGDPEPIVTESRDARIERPGVAVRQSGQQVWGQETLHSRPEAVRSQCKAVRLELGRTSDEPYPQIVHGRHASSEVRIARTFQRVGEVVGRVARHRRVRRERRRLSQHTSRPATLVADDQPALGIARSGINADRQEPGRVENAEVPRDVHQAHRMIRRSGVEVVTSGVPVVCELGVVVPVAPHPSPRLEASYRFAHAFHDVGDGVVGRTTCIDRCRQGQAEERWVIVRFDETRDRRPTVQVFERRLSAGQLNHRALRTSGDHPPVTDRDRFGAPAERVHGSHRTVV